MENKPATVLLRPIGGGDSQPFTPAHAKRLLAYPATRWEAVTEEEADKPKGKQKPAPADTTKD